MALHWRSVMSFSTRSDLQAGIAVTRADGISPEIPAPPRAADQGFNLRASYCLRPI